MTEDRDMSDAPWALDSLLDCVVVDMRREQVLALVAEAYNAGGLEARQALTEAEDSHQAEIGRLTAERDRLREEYRQLALDDDETGSELVRLEDERDAALASLAEERKRANEAARLSAEARDQADELRKALDDLRDFASILERDRTERDDWATRVAERFGLSDGYDDPWGAVPALYHEIEKHMTRLVAAVEAGAVTP
jgi:hypothetical protein